VVASAARANRDAPPCACVSIPFIAGQWSLRGRPGPPRRQALLSQSPSLRGSGRFPSVYRIGMRRRQVSIPFIAGQWSLLAALRRALPATSLSQSPSLRGSGRFAVVGGVRPPAHRVVSIPFIAGQWSLQERARAEIEARREASQSPSLRGSGRFGKRRHGRKRRSASQSPSLRGSGRFDAVARAPGGGAGGAGVSIPFIAGQWSLRRGGGAGAAHGGVSIPFIAGQWSLPKRAQERAKREVESQSPSLRGSGRFRIWKRPPTTRLVSQSPSLRGSGRFATSRPTSRGRWRRLNPLHCGAVVASCSPSRARPSRWRVSIPFIAGQWSLRRRRTRVGHGRGGSQSPSLRGSGRFVIS